MARISTIAFVLLLTVARAFAADPPDVAHIPDVIYGRSYTTALTMDVYTPKNNPKHIGVIAVVSGGWVSASNPSASSMMVSFITPLTQRGFTVFAVSHGSQPKYTIPEILTQMSRAVRFIRYHAKDYEINPDRLCIFGGSAGGHLSLMQAYDPVPPDAKSPDPIDRESANVFAVAAFFPPTDFLNYGKPGQLAWKTILAWLQPPFDFHEVDPKTKKFERITDEAKIEEIAKAISPINYVRAGDPPTLLIHGDADALVPYEQSTTLLAKLKEAGVEAQLITKPGKNHGWPDIANDMQTVADFFMAQTGSKAGATTKEVKSP